MYIYQITNCINQKKYIGSTNNPDRRKKEHFYAAIWNLSPCYHYPLQSAIRKYGMENFSFEIIEECDLLQCSERESYYIGKLNTLTNSGHGYNQTAYTKTALQDPEVIKRNILTTGKPCVRVDIKDNIIERYESLYAASRSIGLNDASCIREVCLGKKNAINGHIFRFVDENDTITIPVITTRKRRTAIVGTSVTNPLDVVYYESVSEASRQENIPRGSISKCINGSTKYSKVHNRIWRKVGDAQ